MRGPLMLRMATFALAVLHTFPARGHLTAFFEHPCLSDGWKGFGALLSIAFYLAPVKTQARALASLWRRHRIGLRVACLVLVGAHAVPAFDHLPRLAHALTWHDGWRGTGAATAMAWFLAPQRWQAKLIARLGRVARLAPIRAPWAAYVETNT